MYPVGPFVTLPRPHPARRCNAYTPQRHFAQYALKRQRRRAKLPRHAPPPTSGASHPLLSIAPSNRFTSTASSSSSRAKTCPTTKLHKKKKITCCCSSLSWAKLTTAQLTSFMLSNIFLSRRFQDPHCGTSVDCRPNCNFCFRDFSTRGTRTLT